ncbi:response regulator [Desulfospira joergensenii]|uniref:response regulator n=1 Tax=Desulfospira joergensenii TaxID=53329 RepID=UPI0003B561E8|nr:response regulator [Desulfospira joergensenii]
MEKTIPKGGSETILFVDDESYIADVGKEMLEDFGYRVDIMTSSRQALEFFRADPLRYDLVITDYSMPEIPGDRLIGEIQRIRPGILAIMCSGTNMTPEITDKVSLARVLIKPFDMEDLLGTVRDVLDHGTP